MPTKLSVLHLSSWQEPCGIADYTATLITGLGSRGVASAVYPIGPGRRANLTADELQESQAEIVDQCRDFQLIHIQHEHSFFLERGGKLSSAIKRFGKLLIALRQAGRPVVVTFHTSPPIDRRFLSILGRRKVSESFRQFRISRAWRKALQPFALDRQLSAIAHTHDTRHRLIHQGIPQGSILRLPLSLPAVSMVTPEERATMLQSLGYAPEVKLLSIFGFISSYKGTDVAIEALKLLPPEYHLAVVGGSHPESRGDRTLNKLLKTCLHPRLQGRVRFTDFVDRPTLRRYQTASTFCLAPYKDIDISGSAGIGLAIGSGNPTIASRISSFLEIQRDSRGALILIAPNAPHELAWKVLRLQQDSGGIKDCVERSIEYARSCSLERITDETLALYERTLGATLSASKAAAPFKAIPIAAPEEKTFSEA